MLQNDQQKRTANARLVHKHGQKEDDEIPIAEGIAERAKDTVDVPANRKMTLKMAPGGGFVMKIMKK